MNVICCLVVLLAMSTNISGGSLKSGNCPLKGNVKNCVPKCMSDYECFGDNKCCSNICGTTSCAAPTSVFSGNDPMRQKNDNVVICGNVKCQPGQKCVSSGSMKRPNCSW